MELELLPTAPGVLSPLSMRRQWVILRNGGRHLEVDGHWFRIALFKVVGAPVR
jgi:hypothetical protein